MTYTELTEQLKEELETAIFPNIQFPQGYDKVSFYKDFVNIKENRFEHLMNNYKELVDFTLLAQNELEIRKYYY